MVDPLLRCYIQTLNLWLSEFTSLAGTQGLKDILSYLLTSTELEPVTEKQRYESSVLPLIALRNQLPSSAGFDRVWAL